MGFWYLLILLIGVVISVIGLVKLKTAGGAKVIVTLFTVGLLIAVSTFLLTPGSSELIADLLNLQ